MISFIVPAHNEEFWIGRCLAVIQDACKTVSEEHEIIVVDDSSTDGTASIAQKHGAHVVRVEHRHIAATRNAGAKAARGDKFFFVDADTLVNAPAIHSALNHIADGAMGGGCVPRFEGHLPLWATMIYPLFVLGVRVLGQPGGSCLFCTRHAFEAAGGFSEAHYAAEDAVFASALKRHGRFVIISDRVITSGRNLRAHSVWSIARLLLRLALRGPNGFRDRRGLDLWYRPMREKPR
jgi:glycosyltransferase involved in cell wall biosynthesis